MSVVHLAGDRIVIGHYAIQRCMLCGKILDEFRFDRIMSENGGSIPALSLGGFYEINGNETRLIKQADGPGFESDLDIPEDCCIRSIWRKSEGGEI